VCYDLVVDAQERKWPADKTGHVTGVPPAVAARSGETRRTSEAAERAVEQLLHQHGSGGTEKKM